MKQLNYFVGTAGSDCRHGTLTDGRAWASFRLAVNFGFYDTEKGEYREIDTSWYDVSCYGDLAPNVMASVHKGDAVIVAGRLRIREWTDDNGKSGRSAQIVAEAVGHNLRFGTAKWARNIRNGARPAGQQKDNHWQVDGPDAPPEPPQASSADEIDDMMVDTDTGEIRADHAMEAAVPN